LAVSPRRHSSAIIRAHLSGSLGSRSLHRGELTLPTIELVLKEISVSGNLVGNFAGLSDLMKLVTEGRIKLQTKRYRLEDAVQALDDLDHGRIAGRGVLVPSGA
jgi:NAD+-dependent secondary alcohol dehydrogenase Adh1